MKEHGAWGPNRPKGGMWRRLVLGDADDVGRRYDTLEAYIAAEIAEREEMLRAPLPPEEMALQKEICRDVWALHRSFRVGLWIDRILIAGIVVGIFVFLPIQCVCSLDDYPGAWQEIKGHLGLEPEGTAAPAGSPKER